MSSNNKNVSVLLVLVVALWYGTVKKWFSELKTEDLEPLFTGLGFIGVMATYAFEKNKARIDRDETTERTAAAAAENTRAINALRESTYFAVLHAKATYLHERKIYITRNNRALLLEDEHEIKRIDAALETAKQAIEAHIMDHNKAVK